MNKKYLIFSMIGFELVGIQFSFIYLGYIIDKEMVWPGFALAGLSILGLVLWLIHIIHMLKKIEDKE